jgi:hypothetical protein
MVGWLVIFDMLCSLFCFSSGPHGVLLSLNFLITHQFL